MTERSEYNVELAFDTASFVPSKSEVALTTCDFEPIHFSGAIQPHGLLLGVSEEDLVTRFVSANTSEGLGVDPSDLLGQPLDRALGPDTTERLLEELNDPRRLGIDPLTCHLPSGAPFEVTWYRVEGLIVIELEPTEGSGSVSASAVFADVRHAMSQLENASDVEELCHIAAAEVRHLTGYSRVMVYRFHADWHGEVIAEQRQSTLEPFLGLNYPASDIPRQARKLFLLNPLRVIADVGYEPVPLVMAPGFEDHLVDLSLSHLRSVSPFHITYLRNMGVQASLTISLMHGTRLWGMLACHHDSPRRIDAQLRAACRMLGQIFSSEIVAKENKEQLAYRSQLAEIEAQLVVRLSGAESLGDALAASGDDVLRLTSALGMVARVNGEIATAGTLPPPAAVELLLSHLRADEEPSELVCDNLADRWSELGAFAEHASGVLALPLSPAFDDFVLWFRGELVQGVTWASDPAKLADGAPRLVETSQVGGEKASPHLSFQTWVQEVRGRSLPWLPPEIVSAQRLAAAIRELLFTRARDRFAHLAMHDGLTGLPNRTLLLDRIAQALNRKHREGGNAALLFVDLDHFKNVNDSFGHAAGDCVLIQAAQRLTAAVRATDTTARIGGDEFAVLCEGVALTELQVLSDRIVESFRMPFEIDGQDVLITTSTGFCLADDSDTPSTLLGNADAAMYRVKRTGGNSSVSFQRSQQVPAL